MIKQLLVKELEKDEYLYAMLGSSIILLLFSIFFNNFFGYICGLGGFAYGMVFLYHLSKNENKVIKYGSNVALALLFVFMIYFMFLNVKPDLYGLILGIIVISIPVIFINKKFFPVVIPLNLTTSGVNLNLTSSLMPMVMNIVKAHPLIVISAGIVAVYMFFKMIKDIIKVVILTVIVWAVLRFLLGLI